MGEFIDDRARWQFRSLSSRVKRMSSLGKGRFQDPPIKPLTRRGEDLRLNEWSVRTNISTMEWVGARMCKGVVKPAVKQRRSIVYVGVNDNDQSSKV